MRWLHPRRFTFRSPDMDRATIEANEANLERVRSLAALAAAQAANAQDAIAAHIAALQQRTDRNGQG